MRFVSRLNLCLLLAGVASARSIVLARAELPACAESCFGAAVKSSECDPTDAPCICDSQGFYESLLPCVLINCGYADVSGLLNYGLEFCQRIGVNSAQRLSMVGNSASGGRSDDDTVVSISVVQGGPTSAPERESVSSGELVAPAVTSLSSEATGAPPAKSTTEPAPPIELTAGVTPTTLLPVSDTTPAPTLSPASSSRAIFSTTSVEIPSDVEPTNVNLPVPTARSRTPSGQFTVETKPQTNDPNTDQVVIKTADPTSRKTQEAATTTPEKTSAPPSTTSDAPSSASATALHMFGHGSLNSFILCLVALFFVF